MRRVFIHTVVMPGFPAPRNDEDGGGRTPSPRPSPGVCFAAALGRGRTAVFDADYTRQALALLACLALVAPRALAEDAGQPLRLPTLGVQVTVPAGWEALQTLEGQGAALGRAGSAGPGLEVVCWEPIAARLSAVAAAKAHEEILGAHYPYAAESQELFTAADGSQAVSVRGAVETPDGRLHVALFAAYVVGKRYFTVGVFCPPDQVAAVREQFLDEALRSFGPLGTRPPATVPVVPAAPPDPTPAVAPPVTPPVTPPIAPPVAPTVTTPAIAPTVTPPVETPIAPPVTPPTVPAVTPAGLPVRSTSHVDPLGFTVDLPRGWDLATHQTSAVAWPPAGDRSAGLAWAVFPARATLGLHERGAVAVREWAQGAGFAWTSLQTRLGDPDRPLAACAGLLEVDGRELRALATLSPGDTVDLLVVAFWRRDTSPTDRGRLAQVAASFRYDRGPREPKGRNGSGQWQTPDGALKVVREPGWVLQGRVHMYNSTPALELEGTHGASGGRFMWRQPQLPMFKDLVPALEKAGWKAGAEFPPDFGTQPLELRKRLAALEVARAAVAQLIAAPTRLAGPSEKAGRLLPGGTGGLAEAQSDASAGGYLCAVADAPASLGRDCWMLAGLSWTGPPEAAAGAGGALRRVILSAELSPDWFATEDEQAALQLLLAGARAAAPGLPDAPSPTGAAAAQTLLDRLAEAHRLTGVLELPAEPTWPWRNADRSLPELAPAWWEGR